MKFSWKKPSGFSFDKHETKLTATCLSIILKTEAFEAPQGVNEVVKIENIYTYITKVHQLNKSNPRNSQSYELINIDPYILSCCGALI